MDMCCCVFQPIGIYTRTGRSRSREKLWFVWWVWIRFQVKQTCFNSSTASVFCCLSNVSRTQTAATLLRISLQNGDIDQTASADVINIQILPVNLYSPCMKSKNSIIWSRNIRGSGPVGLSWRQRRAAEEALTVVCGLVVLTHYWVLLTAGWRVQDRTSLRELISTSFLCQC